MEMGLPSVRKKIEGKSSVKPTKLKEAKFAFNQIINASNFSAIAHYSTGNHLNPRTI